MFTSTTKPQAAQQWPRLIADIGGTNARFALETAPQKIEKIAVLADQAQKLQLAQMSPQLMDGGGGAADLAEPEPIPSSRQTQQPEQPKSWWSRLFGK